MIDSVIWSVIGGFSLGIIFEMSYKSVFLGFFCGAICALVCKIWKGPD